MASVAGMGPEEADSFCAFGRTVPARPENLGPLRHAIVELATRAGADEDVRTDLALAFAEACANVVVHAYGPGEVGFLDVRAEAGGEEITVAVTDHGRGMTPRPDSPGLGLGLPLIANLSDTLQIRDGPGGVGTELVMAFGLKRARA